MKSEKHPHHKTKERRGIFIKTGLIAAMGLVILAFQWNAPITEPHIKYVFDDEDPLPYTATRIADKKVKVPAEDMGKSMVDMMPNLFEETENQEINTESDVEFEWKFDEIGEEDIFLEVPIDSSRVWKPGKEVYPKYKGGHDQFLKDLGNELDYPYKERTLGIEGNIEIRFIVEKDGTISHPEIIKGATSNMDKEAIRALLAIPNYWEPASQNGKNVRSYFLATIKFQLSQ